MTELNKPDTVEDQIGVSMDNGMIISAILILKELVAESNHLEQDAIKEKKVKTALWALQDVCNI